MFKKNLSYKKEKSMNIKILNVMLGKGKGGLETVFFAHTEKFKASGHKAVVLCHKKSPYLKNLKELNIPIYTTTASRWNPCVWVKIIKTIKTVRPDIICLHGNRAVYFFTSRLLKLFVHPFPKLMATTHNNRNKLFHRLDGVFVISEALKEGLINQFHIPVEKIFKCPNAVPMPSQETKYQIHNPVRFGFCGRLENVKGCDVLLKACVQLKEKHLPFELIVAGDGSLAETYKQFVRNNDLTDVVKFVGWIEDKVSFFNSIDVLCMPSRSEGQPLSLLEALSFKKAVIVSTCVGMMEVINYKGAGCSFEIENSDELAEKIAHLIQNPDACYQFSKNAYQTYLDLYTPSVQEKNLLKGIHTVYQKKVK